MHYVHKYAAIFQSWCLVCFLLEIAFPGVVGSQQTVQHGKWWKTQVVYQVFPRSFQDSDGDGTGDLRGIEQRLPYLKELGVEIIWISPIFKSPMRDSGYDIEDYLQVDPLFGTMDDMRELIDAAKKLGIRILLDFVPNHTSNESAWFAESRSSKTNPKRNWYVWHPGKLLPDGTRVPPNNWRCPLGPAWTWDEQTQEYYYHAFGDSQPDLNYRNPEVVAAMQDILRFWMRMGIAGFRTDAADHLLEDAALRDDRFYPDCTPKVMENNLDAWRCEIHDYTQGNPENHAIFRGWRKTIDEFDDRAIFAEAFEGVPGTVGMYGTKREPEFNFPFYQKFLGDDLLHNATKVQDVIREYGTGLPEWCHGTWVLGNHDVRRVLFRLSNSSAWAATAYSLFALLPGTPLIYNGDEIAMGDFWVSDDKCQDPNCQQSANRFDHDCRDPSRTPMQWDSTPQAGFSSNSNTYLPINPNYIKVNVEAEGSDGSSPLSNMKRVLEFRKANPDIALGHITHVAADLPADMKDHVVAVQYSSGCSWSLTVANWDTTREFSLHLPMFFSEETKGATAATLQVRFSTVTRRKGYSLDANSFVLEKGEVVVLGPSVSECSSEGVLFM